jgi:deoxyadenosine/deoxycytidine kinase
LDKVEMLLYQRLYRLLAPQLVKPDLVVYLQAEPEILMERIRSRGVPFEVEMEGEYVEKVSQAYRRFFLDYRESPLLRVNNTQLDFVNNREDLDGLIANIQCRAKGILD